MAKTKIQSAGKPAVSEKTQGNSVFSRLNTETKISLGLLVILLFIVATIRSKFAGIPFERDEGIYGYIGKLILEGKTPYKDFYEQKFPGLFYFYGCMVWLFGESVEGLHKGFMYLNLISIILIYFAVQKIFTPVAGIISAVTFAFVSLTPNLSGFTIQAEHGVALFICLGIFFYAFYHTTQKWYYNFLMGISFGFAFMTKTSGIFLLLWGGGTLVFAFLFSKEIKLKDLVIQALTYSAGVLLVFGLFLILILMKDSFNEMIYWAYETPKKYVGKIKFEDGIKYFEYTRDAIIQNHKFFWVHSLLAIGVCLLKPISFRMKFVGLSLLFFSFCTIVPGYYFYGHYWIQTIPGLAFMAGLCYYGIITFLKDGLKLSYPNLKYVYLSLFVVLTVKHVSALKSYYFHPNYERILRSVYGSNPFPESMEIANYINANSKPEDQIVVIGSEPQIYLYTKKRAPSRHAYFAAIVSDVPEHKQWQREFVADVEKAAPRYLIFFNHSISLFVQPNTDQYWYTWANKYITDNYHLVGIADMVDGMQTNYLWKEAMANYKPSGQNIIYTYERNSATPAVSQP